MIDIITFKDSETYYGPKKEEAFQTWQRSEQIHPKQIISLSYTEDAITVFVQEDVESTTPWIAIEIETFRDSESYYGDKKETKFRDWQREMKGIDILSISPSEQMLAVFYTDAEEIGKEIGEEVFTLQGTVVEEGDSWGVEDSEGTIHSATDLLTAIDFLTSDFETQAGDEMEIRVRRKEG